MDYDDDGTLDFVSGSYDPGDVYLFRGLGDGKYADGSKLLDADGVPLVHHPRELERYNGARAGGEEGSIRDRVASFGSWPCPVDWDGDGDLDMLIGSFGGKVWLRTNDGTRSAPVWSGESTPVSADGEPIQVTCHADPVAADWNGDGRFDLVVGSGDGSVVWFENTGTATAPAFGPAQSLVAAKAEHKFLTQLLAHGEQPGPGVRAQICVVDHDLDGQLDLLVGDFSQVEQLRELDADERAGFDALEREVAAVTAQLTAAASAEAQEQHEARLQALQEQRKRFFVPVAAKGVFGKPTHSYVWLFRRLPVPTGPR